MEVFEYLVSGINKDRWSDITDISVHAGLLLDRIKALVPTGNTPSIGFPNWITL